MLKTLVLSLVVPLFVCPIQGTQKAEPAPYLVPEAYQIYASILPERWPIRVAHAKKLVISAETVEPFRMCLQPEGESVALLAPVIENFVEMNKRSWLLQASLQLDQPYEFVSEKELKTIFQAGPEGWKAFYDKYPDSGGYNELSAVGFNADKTIAIVYEAHSCGGLCGAGDFYVLEKKDGNWQPLKWRGTSCSWMS